MLECVLRYRDEDFAETTWQLGRFLWAPIRGLNGILGLTPFKDVSAASGSETTARISKALPGENR